MAEPKNPFDFGTGSIDKDQWLRDIDNEQDAFISRYGNAANKHRTALLRQAFADLRARIANGDMLNRTADGNYQFGSALNREDKHMQEAYQRALGFMGGLARRQILAPPAAEPEKKAIGSLEERYIKSLNPSGKFNTEAYWKNQTDEERRTALKDFLNRELKDADNYQDFGNFGNKDTYTQRLQTVMNLLESGKANDWSLQQLGFTKNWLTLPQQLEQEEEKPKTRLEQAQENYQAAVADQQAALIEQQLAAMNTPTPQFTSLLSFDPTQYWTYDSYIRGRDKAVEALKYTDENGNQFLKSGVTISRVPGGNGRFTEQRTTRNTAWNGQAAKDARTYAQRQYINGIGNDLSNYFKNLGVNYQSYLGNNTSKNNLMTNLSKLFTLDTEGNFVLPDIISKLFAKLEDGKYGLRGSTLSYDPASHTLYNGSNIDTYGEGGVIKGQNGLLVDDSYYVKPTKNTKKPEETSKLENSEEMDAGDWITILGTTAADIGSMLSANAVGAGTAVSAGLGVASTLGNSVNDFRHGNVGSGLANLGIGLTTDLIGLVPGFGAGAKGYKIGRTLTRFARPLMAAFAANNFKEAGEVLGKGVKNGFGSLTALDWTVLSTALTSMISRGKSAHTRLKNVEFMSKASQHSSPTDAKGNVTKHIINEEGFIKARKELLDLKRFGYNTSSKKYTKNVWNSIPEGEEISTPFYAKPFEWPRFGFGKNKKLKLVEEFEEFLKESKRPEASPLGSGPDAPVVVPNENANGFYPLIKNGAKLKALRKGGIIKALFGTGSIYINTPYAPNPVLEASAALSLPYQWLPPVQFNPGTTEQPRVTVPLDPNAPRSNYRLTVNFGDATPSFFIDLTISANKQDANRGTNLAGSRSRYSVPAAGGQTLQNYKSAMDAQLSYYKANDGKNIMGDVYNYYNVWKQKNPESDYKAFVDDYNKHVGSIRDTHKTKFELGPDGKPKHKVNETGWEGFNQEHHMLYPSYGEYDQNKEQWLGESTWRRLPNGFDSTEEMDELRRGFLKAGDNSSYIHMKNDGTLELQDATTVDGKTRSSGPPEEEDGAAKAKTRGGDEETGIDTEFQGGYKNPIDPTPFIIAGKTMAGLLGNKDVYGKLIDEMPQAPLRDPINRQLAIVGWQERVKQGQNQLADLRRIQQIQQGSDQQTNFATALETERVGRDIMDKAFQEDSGRQFETAGKLWNLKNEDIMYNTQVSDANRRAIADRKRMIAQIRAAWRSGDNNIIMGGISDAGNWLLKKYQREQDIVDKSKELALGTPEEQAQASLQSDTEYSRIMNKHAAGQTLTDEEKAYVRRKQAEALRDIRGKFAQSYYGTYHSPWFGGGYREQILKDGGSLEKEKLRARGKDNDRYVSMIKDLRQTSYRRRRRR